MAVLVAPEDLQVLQLAELPIEASDAWSFGNEAVPVPFELSSSAEKVAVREYRLVQL